MEGEREMGEEEGNHALQAAGHLGKNQVFQKEQLLSKVVAESIGFSVLTTCKKQVTLQ